MHTVQLSTVVIIVVVAMLVMHVSTLAFLTYEQHVTRLLEAMTTESLYELIAKRKGELGSPYVRRPVKEDFVPRRDEFLPMRDQHVTRGDNHAIRREGGPAPYFDPFSLEFAPMEVMPAGGLPLETFESGPPAYSGIPAYPKDLVQGRPPSCKNYNNFIF